MAIEQLDQSIPFNLPDGALREFPAVDRQASFQIEGEKDENGKEVEGRVFWVRVVDGQHFIEGKFYQPKGVGNKQLVVFEPGLPGDGVVIFEDRHAPNLVKEGYAIFVARHNGTVTNAQNSQKYIHSAQKQEWSKQHQQEHLGDFTFQEWGREVGTALKGLEEPFEEIHCVAHSMGAPNTLKAFTELPAHVIKKISSFTSLSGAVGRLRDNGNLDPEGKLSLAWIKNTPLKFVKQNNVLHGIDPEQNIEQLAANYRGIYGFDFTPFKKTRFLFMTPTTVLGRDPDEYVTMGAAREICARIKSFGAQSTVKEYGTRKPEGKEAHDLLHLQTSIISRWLKGK